MTIKTSKDRRIKYTKMVLRESLIGLLEHKPIERITIKEICEEADINRATFYSHYADQYDLLKQIEEDLYTNISSSLSQLSQDPANPNTLKQAENIFDYLRDNARITRLLLSDRGDFSFQKRVMQLVYELITTQLRMTKALSVTDAEYVYAFTITGCVGIVQKWLDDDMRKSSKAMAKVVIGMTLGLIQSLKTDVFSD
jgi:AcrR family transcriptional regulator